MKKIASLSFAAIVLATSSLSHAQFGNVLNALKSGGSSAQSADIGVQQDVLTRSYVAAGKEVLKANSQLAAALGINAASINATETSNAVTAQGIEDQDKAIGAGSAAVADALKSGATLKDAEAKAKYAQGLVHLAKGVKQYSGMGKDASAFTSSLSSVNPLQLPGLQSAVYIVRSLPGNLTNLGTVLKQAIDFARTNGVELPKDATDVI